VISYKVVFSFCGGAIFRRLLLKMSIYYSESEYNAKIRLEIQVFATKARIYAMSACGDATNLLPCLL
jgi:hypothetical protein